MTPYDLWKSKMYTEPESLKLDANKDIKLVYDHASKAYLTQGNGTTKYNDYKS
jgi:hypothetical protein